MKSLNIMKIGNSSTFSWPNLLKKYLRFHNYFEVDNPQNAYELSFYNDFDLLIVENGIEENEEQTLINFFNEKNLGTVFIPYSIEFKKKIKKRIKILLLERESLSNPCK
ncbi:hypothetical protein ACFSKN_18690 [Mariniflexile gromovii]|uniref:Uncharacterized protein n=1 Tax=Mariniflexile gromovii TaxID=362523 RepID=A0ABS4BUP3_9FLAO|nr:hypothetical protein [Mariniflexile gromovii]MBP0904310.1 hypothetical protein [Mariniflexile gromovii]